MYGLTICTGYNFNPRSRVGSDGDAWAVGRDALHFNPRSRVGSDVSGVRGMAEHSTISIHAPAWGATDSRCNAVSSYRFQSTLPRGERLLAFQRSQLFCGISIHAPAWGATH